MLINSKFINKIAGNISLARNLNKDIVLREILETIRDIVREQTGEEVDDSELLARAKNFDMFYASKLRTRLLVRLKELEKESNYEKLKSCVGKIVHCKVKHFLGDKYIVEWKEMEFIVTRSDISPFERLYEGLIYAFCVLEREEKAYLNRNSEKFIETLMRNNIPEIDEGKVRIIRILRKPGYKAIVIVDGSVQNAIGICVGPRGSRIKAVIEELKGEKIEIIDDNLGEEEIIRKIIAKNFRVIIKDFYDRMVVVVHDKEDLIRMLGRGGINVKMVGEIIERPVEIYTYEDITALLESNAAEYLEFLLDVCNSELEARKLSEKIKCLKFLNSTNRKLLCEILGEEDGNRIFDKMLRKFIIQENKNLEEYEELKPDIDDSHNIYEILKMLN